MRISMKYTNLPLNEVNGAINQSLKEIGEFVSADRGYIFDYDFENNIILCKYKWCRKGIISHSWELENTPLETVADLVELHKKGLMLLIPDVLALCKDNKIREILEHQGVKTLITLPIMVEGECSGFVGFDYVNSYKKCNKNEMKLFELFSQIQSNVRKRKIQENKLLAAKLKVEEANKLKSSFLANVSHEIRTPMNGILGFLQLLENTTLNEEQMEFVDNIKISADILLTVINNILDVSEIESKKMELEQIKFDLRSTIETVVIPFTAKAREKDLELNILIKSDVPKMVRGDPTKLRQVISNLVSNAIKFTEQGEIFIEVDLNHQTDEFNEIMVKIKDTGIGMSIEIADKIFESFTQADNSLTRTYGGTGLGLSICRSIIEMMNGNIWVESGENKGSTFIFTIPLRKVHHEEIPKFVNCSSLKGKRILVVDDNAMNREIVKIYLQEAGCMVVEAESGTEALNKLIRINESSNIKFSAVLLDHQMTGMNDRDLPVALKSISSTKDIPLILLTSVVGKGEANKAKYNGFVGYLSKPYRRDELLDCVAMVIEEKKNNSSEEEIFITRHIAREVKFNQKIKILVADNNKISKTLIIKILHMNDLSCDIAENGEEAVRACLEKNYDIVFMNYQVPVMDGYEATRKIREAEGDNKHTVIIAITAYAMEDDIKKCFDNGMDDYLSKPVNKDIMMKMIEKWTSKYV